MNRREFTAAVGLIGTGLLAGCVSDDGSDTAGGNGDENGTENGDENGDERTPTPTETEEAASEGSDGGDTESGSGDSPVAVVGSFFEAYRAGEAEQINQGLHPEGPDPVSSDSAAEYSKLEFSIETIEVTEQTENRAVVDVSFSEDSDETVRILDTIVLRPSDGGWRIYSFETNQSQQPSAPNAAFETEQEGDAVTITHTSGDSIPAAELSIRGEGLAETGPWESLGGETDDEGKVTAGRSVTVETTDSAVPRRSPRPQGARASDWSEV